MNHRPTCPECKSESLESKGAPISAGGKLWFPRRCQKCGYFWSAEQPLKLLPPAPPAAKLEAPAPAAELQAVPPAPPAAPPPPKDGATTPPATPPAPGPDQPQEPAVAKPAKRNFFGKNVRK